MFLYRRLQDVFKAQSLAAEAEEGLENNNLKSAYRGRS